MKNRKNILIAFVLIAALCVGVGFAATTDLLNVDGKLNVDITDIENAFDVSVDFKSVAVADTSTGDKTKVSANVDSSDPDVINVKIDKGAFNVVDETIVLTCTIENTGSQAATLAFTGTDTVPKNFEITHSFANATNTTLAAGATTDATITITMKTIPAAAVVDADFKVQITATLVTE